MMSALPPVIEGSLAHVRFVPKADIACRYAATSAANSLDLY